ncbi:hypothetical protein NQZ79_g7857 [Umbelopsis isabellina]|nr:hypothetical protein NQZ79_g7857 [Umbelopsis isabellina]
MTPAREDQEPNVQCQQITLANLPYTVLCNIFKHLQDNPASFSLTCHSFHNISLETVNVVEYFCEKYGQALALFLAILRHPRRLTENVTRALLKRDKVLMPRNLAQRLLQGYGVERKMSVSTIMLLLDTAVQRYGHFEVAEDDWRKTHEFINQLMWIRRGVSPHTTDQVMVEFTQFLESTQFIPFPFAQSLRAHTILYYHPPFERMVTSLQLFAPAIFANMVNRGLTLRYIEASHFIISFISFGIKSDFSPRETGLALQNIISYDIMEVNQSTIRSVFARMTDESCWSQIEALKCLQLPFNMGDVVEEVLTELFDDPLLRDESIADYPYRALFINWPCRQTITRCMKNAYSIDENELQSALKNGVGYANFPENAIFNIPPRTLEWVAEHFEPDNIITQICFDNIVLVLANPIIPPYLHHNPTGNDPVIRIFKMYIRHDIRLTHRHINWFKKCKRSISIRTVMNAVMDNGVIQEDNTIAYGRFALSKCAQSPACRSAQEMEKLKLLYFGSISSPSDFTSSPAITAKLRHRHPDKDTDEQRIVHGLKRRRSRQHMGSSASKKHKFAANYIPESRRSWRAYLEELLNECAAEREENFMALNSRRTRKRKHKVAAKSLFEVLCSEMLHETTKEDGSIIASQLGDCCSACGLLLDRDT